MRIGVDIRALTPPVTGTGVYLREILRELVLLVPDAEVFCYTTKAEAGEGLPTGPFQLRVGRGPTARWGTLWMQSGLVRQAARDRLDLFWGPLQVVPLPLLGRVPTVVTLHDLVFELYPETMSLRNRLALPFFARRSLRGADAVLAVSRATAALACERLGLEPDRMIVTPHGTRFAALPRAEAEARVAATLDLDPDYVLFVGTQEPRKNLDGLLAALAALTDRGLFDGELVLVGAPGWKTSSLFDRYREHSLARRIRALGFVADELLPALYGAARMLVMPSLYEGFGLPVLEAMSCGAPVVCSDRPPFPEITGEAARLYPAGDPQALAGAIYETWHDADLRSRLRRLGLERAAGFSWRRAAEQVRDCFVSVAGQALRLRA